MNTSLPVNAQKSLNTWQGHPLASREQSRPTVARSMYLLWYPCPFSQVAWFNHKIIEQVLPIPDPSKIEEGQIVQEIFLLEQGSPAPHAMQREKAGLELWTMVKGEGRYFQSTAAKHSPGLKVDHQIAEPSVFWKIAWKDHDEIENSSQRAPNWLITKDPNIVLKIRVFFTWKKSPFKKVLVAPNIFQSPCIHAFPSTKANSTHFQNTKPRFWNILPPNSGHHSNVLIFLETKIQRWICRSSFHIAPCWWLAYPPAILPLKIGQNPGGRDHLTTTILSRAMLNFRECYYILLSHFGAWNQKC